MRKVVQERLCTREVAQRGCHRGVVTNHRGCAGEDVRKVVQERGCAGEPPIRRLPRGCAGEVVRKVVRKDDMLSCKDDAAICCRAVTAVCCMVIG